MTELALGDRAVPVSVPVAWRSPGGWEQRGRLSPALASVPSNQPRRSGCSGMSLSPGTAPGTGLALAQPPQTATIPALLPPGGGTASLDAPNKQRCSGTPGVHPKILFPFQARCLCLWQRLPPAASPTSALAQSSGSSCRCQLGVQPGREGRPLWNALLEQSECPGAGLARLCRVSLSPVALRAPG